MEHVVVATVEICELIFHSLPRPWLSARFRSLYVCVLVREKEKAEVLLCSKGYIPLLVKTSMPTEF